ncbi:MAG: hypothetical protein ACM3YE_10850 [Bacteroidota bacterium]
MDNTRNNARIVRASESKGEKMFGFPKEDFSKIVDPTERKVAVLESYFKKRNFNPLSFALFVWVQYWISFTFMSVMLLLIKSFRFEISKLVAISILVISITPVVFSTWIELIKVEKSHYKKLGLNSVFTVIIFILFALYKHFPTNLIYFVSAIIVFTNLFIGLLKINYEDIKVREKLMYFIVPVLIYFFVGVLALIFMMCLTFVRLLS